MSVGAGDIKFRKPVAVTDTAANGGRKGHVEVVSGARHNLFPRVSRAERLAGLTRYRKEFWCNENPDDDIAYAALLYLEFPSNGGDRFYLGSGTQVDTQALIADVPVWMGVGALFVALSGGETSIQLTMEANDFQFPNGGKLHLTDKFKADQTIASGVGIGDSVEDSAGTWIKVAATSDITYPKGIYVGNNTVLTIETTTHEEWLEIVDYLYTDEDIGDGDGADTSPALTTLAHNTNGICEQIDKLPVVTATCGGTQRTVNVAADGSCSGYCSAGQLNMATGAWTAAITWTTAPDNLTDITVTYREESCIYSGNVATVYLAEQVANAYTTGNSYGAGCLEVDEVSPLVESWVENSIAGTYDEAAYPLIMYNDGTERDTWTLTFSSPTAFTCIGSNEGDVGSGGVSSDFSPVNPETGQPYFTVDKDGWAGSWAAGDTVTFVTSPSAVPIWWKEVVPAATAQEPDNLAVLGWYCE